MTNTTLNILNQYKKLILETSPIDFRLLRDIYEAIDREFESNDLKEKDNLIEILKDNIEKKEQIIEKMVNDQIAEDE